VGGRTHIHTHTRTRGYVMCGELDRHSAPHTVGLVGRQRFEAGAEPAPVHQGVTLEIVGIGRAAAASRRPGPLILGLFAPAPNDRLYLPDTPRRIPIWPQGQIAPIGSNFLTYSARRYFRRLQDMRVL